MNLRDKVLEYRLNIKAGPAFNSNFKLLLESWEKVPVNPSVSVAGSL